MITYLHTSAQPIFKSFETIMVDHGDHAKNYAPLKLND